MLRGLFARRAGQAEPARDGAARVKDLVRGLAEWPDGTEITASEIVCLDPSCPGVETVVLVMIPGRRTRAVKVRAASADVTEQRMRGALVEAGFGVRE